MWHEGPCSAKLIAPPASAGPMQESSKGGSKAMRNRALAGMGWVGGGLVQSCYKLLFQMQGLCKAAGGSDAAANDVGSCSSMHDGCMRPVPQRNTCYEPSRMCCSMHAASTLIPAHAAPSMQHNPRHSMHAPTPHNPGCTPGLLL